MAKHTLGREVCGTRIYNVEEVAELLDVGAVAVRKWVASGELAARRWPRQGSGGFAYVVSEPSIRRFLDGTIANGAEE